MRRVVSTADIEAPAGESADAAVDRSRYLKTLTSALRGCNVSRTEGKPSLAQERAFPSHATTSVPD
jgi:hypothetical protein